MTSLRKLSILLLSFIAAVPLAAQGATAALFTRVEGGTVRAAIEIEIGDGWHLYHSELGHPEAIGKPTTVALSGAGIRWSEVRFPEPERLPQGIEGEDGEEIWIYAHEGTLVLYASGELADGASGKDASAELKGLVCKLTCVPYRETLRTKGAGTDALFASFSADLLPKQASAKKPAPDESPAPKRDELIAGKADASLFTRIDGKKITAGIEIAIDSGWHLYHDELGHPEALGKTTNVELKGGGVTWGKVHFPEPHKIPQGFDGEDGEEVWIYGHEGTIVLWADGEIAAGSSGGGIHGAIKGQTCEIVCINYTETIVSKGRGDDALFATIDAERSALAAEGGAGADPAAPEEEGLLGFLLLAVFWGLFTLLMPCTYPMIPITISFFTKQAEARGGRVLPLSLAYGAGIVLVFVLIGAVIGRAIIPFATHPVTNLVIGILFLYFAFVLFGVLKMQPPRFLLNAAGKASMRGGYIGVFFMGATLVVTSFTCTAPFVGSLLSAGAADGNLGRIVLGMGVFGLTMAIPFVLLSLLPSRIQAMPRSGEWMNTLKVFLGFVEVAAALKFFSNSDLVWEWGLISREFFLAGWGIIFTLAALYLFGVFTKRGTARPGGKRLVSATLSFAFAGYCLWAMTGRPLDPIMSAFAPPYSGGRIFPAWYSPRGDWQIVKDDYDQALEMARQDDKLLLVNFTGFT